MDTDWIYTLKTRRKIRGFPSGVSLEILKFIMEGKWRLSITVLLLLMYLGNVVDGNTKCAYVNVVNEISSTTTKGSTQEDGGSDTDTTSKSSSSSSTTLQGEVLPDNRTMQCTKSSDFCYALWKENPENKSSITILAQGCWASSGEYDCRRQTECVADFRPMKAMNHTKFCCCSGDLCNMNMTESDVPFASEEPETIQLEPAYQKSTDGTNTLVITTVSVISFFLLVILVFLAYRHWIVEHKQSPDSVHLMEAQAPPSPSLDMESLKLHEIVGRGRYGSVWRGTLNDYEVAVKVFAHQHRQYFLNERDIYSLPFMEHPSLMKFIGGDQRPSTADCSRMEYYLVMGHAPFGCLQDYLRNNVVDWTTLCRMTQGIAKGLAHLHTDVRRGDKAKPCISHRDVNSRNVLVKADLGCALCDMGFAMKIAGSKYYSQNGEEQHAETTSLTDVGTLRYMAPEVLEGAVNLRDCESSLKQIDVYAMGLVIWEVATRCSDLYQGLDVPDYKLPFEIEIGLHPTFEQMQVLVSRNKARPLFPEVWKDTNLAVRLLKETIEDCWDQDAEARLTSLCVEERLQELPILWDRHKMNMGISGMSPTVNPTFPLSSNRQPSVMGMSLTDASSGSELTDRNANIMGIISLADATGAPSLLSNRAGSSYQQLNHHGETSVSENTVETTVTMSPSEPLLDTSHHQGKNRINHQAFPWLPMALQPHQGRNPCLERNMIMEPVEEVSISGNTLLEKGSNNKGLLPQALLDGGTMAAEVGNLFDALHLVDSMESNSLVNHDVLGQSSRNYHPIPYLQNAVHNSLPVHCTTVHCPKQPNVPGNGQHAVLALPKPIPHKKGPFSGRFERKKGTTSGGGGGGCCVGGGRRNKDWSGIRSLLDWTRLTRSAGSGGEEDEVDKASSNLGLKNGVVPAQRAMSDSTLNTEKSNLISQRLQDHNVWPNTCDNQKLQTEVCLANGTVGSNDSRHSGKPIVRLTNGHIKNDSLFKSAELGVAKLEVQHGQAPVIKTRSGSQPEVGELLASTSKEEYFPKPEPSSSLLRRPNTLSVQGHNFFLSESSASEDFQNGTLPEPATVDRKSNCGDDDRQQQVSKLQGTKEKIEQRVKTPFALKPGRFSLYDDRMMSSSSWLNSGSEKRIGRNTSNKLSVSVPGNIDSLCEVQIKDNSVRGTRTMVVGSGSANSMEKKRQKHRHGNRVGQYEDSSSSGESRGMNHHRTNLQSQALMPVMMNCSAGNVVNTSPVNKINSSSYVNINTQQQRRLNGHCPPAPVEPRHVSCM